MSSWRDQILKEFTPKVARLTLVADPDGLLFEEGILQGIRERGFELIPFEDHIAFRYAYESKYRSRWDRGEQTDLVVVLQSQASNLTSLPYDLLHAGRKLFFNIGDIFPNLSYPVVDALDRGYLDSLYEAQIHHAPGHLGDNATKEFVLRHVFEIAPELIKQSSDLLRVLLRRHYQGQRIPTILDERFIQLLRQNNAFSEWPLERIVPDREAFFTFLQERWPIFLNQELAKDKLGENGTSYNLTIDGPVNLSFNHPDIRIYIDNLFTEGFLYPVSHKHAGTLSKTWLGIGVLTDPISDRTRRIEKLVKSLEASIPAEDARHVEWFHFARGWAELTLLSNVQSEGISELIGKHIEALQQQVDTGFVNWIMKRYAGLINLPPVPPVMLHHLPRFLFRQIEGNRDVKIAMVLIDGLAMDQWLVIKESLSSRQSSFYFREKEVFAWIPSLTSVSRQATFAGKAPIYFPNTIQTTDKESALWTQFWVDQGLIQNEVVYIKGLGDGNLDNLSESISHPKARAIGLVINKVDKIMHGMEMGSAGMHNQVRQWSQQAYLQTLLNMLLDQDFLVFLTSDHGNIEARGCGRPEEGALADLRGERVRIYSDGTLRDKVRERFPSSLSWHPIGLPADYLPLIAPNRIAFVRKGESIVSHGGITIEELIVPLVQIERRPA